MKMNLATLAHPTRLKGMWLAASVAIALAACDDARFRVRTPPGQQVDVFSQHSVPTIDVLWVVDNSSSMQEEQEALAQNFGSFYDYLDHTGADFHIGVISTDIYNPAHQGRLLGETPIISRDTPEAEAVFAQNVMVGIEGKGDEQGFRAAELALSEPLVSGPNAGFLRDDAYLFLIFVSDEDDHTFGDVAYYLRRFEQIKGIGNDGMVKVAAVVEQPDTDCPDAQPGTRYVELAADSGGLSVSICEQNFAGNLDALGFSAAGLKRAFDLSRTPIPQSVAVWVKTSCASDPLPPSMCELTYDDCDGAASDVFGQVCVAKQSLPDGWAYEPDSSSIRFYGLAVPPFGAVIEVGYIPVEETR
jgi:hypothetical protein